MPQSQLDREQTGDSSPPVLENSMPLRNWKVWANSLWFKLFQAVLWFPGWESGSPIIRHLTYKASDLRHKHAGNGLEVWEMCGPILNVDNYAIHINLTLLWHKTRSYLRHNPLESIRGIGQSKGHRLKFIWPRANSKDSFGLVRFLKLWWPICSSRSEVNFRCFHNMTLPSCYFSFY